MSSNTQSVLVVEDEASIASFVSLYLKNAGYEVRTASNGAEALASAQSEQPSLIVLDLMLPDMEGWDFRHKQKKDSRIAGIPVIGVSAVGKLVDVEYSFRKPLDYDQLLAAVEQFVARPARL